MYYYSDTITVNCCRGSTGVMGRKPGKVLFSAADGSRPMTSSTWVDCYIWYSMEGPGPLLAVPNVGPNIQRP